MADDLIETRKKHALMIRWTHWVNFPLLTLMLFSGIEIYWAHRVYTPFIPDSVYRFFGVEYHLATGLALHFTLMWVFVLNGLVYVTYLALSGEWRELLPTRASFRDAFFVLLHDLKLRKHLPPQGKFNGGQRIAYTAILVMGALATVSGLAIYKPTQLRFLSALFAGYEGARLAHFLLAVGFLLFFAVHIAQVLRAGFHNFQSMITGEEVIHEQNQQK